MLSIAHLRRATTLNYDGENITRPLVWSECYDKLYVNSYKYYPEIEMANDAMFNDDDEADLSSTKLMRTRIASLLGTFVPEVVPGEDVEMPSLKLVSELNKTLDSIDNAVLKKKALLIKSGANDTANARNALVANLLRQVSSKKSAQTTIDGEAPDDIIPKDIQKGELDVGRSPIDPSNFLDED